MINKLRSSPLEPLLKEAEASAYLNVPTKTLRQWRWKGAGPHFIKLRGKMVRYRQADLDAFVESGARRSTSDVH